jgi:Fe-S-cluster containining protein
VQTLIRIETADRQLLAAVDGAMAEAARRSGEWLLCRPGCTQCCMGQFEITQLDALRLRRGLAGTDAATRERLRARAAAYAGGDDEPCPALDPATGLCELYAFRPITCRTFGPVTHTEDGLGACDLCYAGASDEEMAACAVEADPDNLEPALLAQLPGDATTVASALLTSAF